MQSEPSTEKRVDAGAGMTKLGKSLTYLSYTLVGLLLALIMMGKNVRTDTYYQDAIVTNLPNQQVEALIQKDASKLSFKASFTVKGQRLVTVGTFTAFIVFLLPLPLIFCVLAFYLIRSKLSGKVAGIFLLAPLLGGVMLLFSFPRA